MKEHIFLISAIRPELLVEQVESFAVSKGSRKLKFYVFNDKNENDNKFQKAISALSKQHPSLHLYYFSLAEQIDILRKAAKKYSPLLQVSEQEILDCFKENGKFQGLRSIQNKSVFIFYLVNKDRRAIVHRLDDDIFAYEAEQNKNVVNIRLKYDFFPNKEKILSGNPLTISGSNYTIDSPSPLAQYADFTEFLYNFYKLAKRRKGDDLIGSDILEISPSRVSLVNDPLKILEMLPPNATMTYHEALLFLEKHIEILHSGNSRLVINDNRKKDFNSKSIFPGGCVSFLYDNLPILTPHFGNQDLLRQLFEILDGKKICSDGYIGHRKSNTERPSIIDDLKRSSYRHQTHITYSVFEYIRRRNLQNNSLRDFQENFINVMDRWIQEAFDYTNKINLLLKDKTNWYTNKSYKSTIAVQTLCSSFLNSYQEILENFSTKTLGNIESVIDDYYKKKQIFDNLMQIIYKENLLD